MWTTGFVYKSDGTVLNTSTTLLRFPLTIHNFTTRLLDHSIP